ncbi:MAG: hypothetical protein AB1657_01400 [Candidatus Micrarchaeota archaeon]
MGSRKAFIFSLDSFVAFTLTVAAIYTLIFFSTVPSAYYSSLMQANYLAKDTLLALATTSFDEEQAYLDYIIGELPENRAPARKYAGALIPAQFGYRLETWDEEAGSWTLMYDTADDPASKNKKEYHKLKATAQSLYLVVDEPRDPGSSPYGYITCSGPYTVCGTPPYEYETGDVSLQLVRLTVYT